MTEGTLARSKTKAANRARRPENARRAEGRALRGAGQRAWLRARGKACFERRRGWFGVRAWQEGGISVPQFWGDYC